jgi:L-lysine 6-transaminase
MRDKSKPYLDEFAQYVVMYPYPFVIDLKRSKGAWIHTLDGDSLFDWAGYYGSRLIGHNHPKMFEPEYIEKLIYAANNKMANPDFLTPECVAYYRKLYELAPICIKNPRLEIYAVNSGAEAVENLLKYFINLYDTRRIEQNKPIGIKRIIYFEQAFHGRTIFTLNITRLSHVPLITKDFEHMVLGNIQVPFPAIDTTLPEEENMFEIEHCLKVLREHIEKAPEEIVGIIIEPIQGAGGHRMTYPHFFRKLSKIAHEFGIALGFDEVQTAGGQTGTFFMVDSFDLPYPPQGIAAGKKLANGIIYMHHPMKDIGILDSTWGGNLADMVRFCQEMKVVEEEKLLEQIPEKANVMVSGLNGLAEKHADKIYNIRGMGIYQGFSLRHPEKLTDLLDYALEKEKMILLEAGIDTIRFRSALDVTIPEIKLMLEKLDRCIAQIA